MIDVKSVERLAYGYELMHRAICNLAGTRGENTQWYIDIAQRVYDRVDGIFEVCATSNPAKNGDCLTGYKIFLSENVPEPAAQPVYDRMLALVERVATPGSISADTYGYTSCIDEARAIMAELRPVDPDLIEARKIAAEATARSRHGVEPEKYLSGDMDDEPGMFGVLKALKRGRELAVQP